MIYNLSSDRLEAARKELSRRRSNNRALQQQVNNVKELLKERGYIDYLAESEIHTLWSDGEDYGAFENDHQCWDLLAKLR